MLKSFILFAIIAVLSSCGTNFPAETPMPTEPSLIGRVDIASPQLGSIIYAELLFASGSIQGVDAFQLRVETVDGDVLYDAKITGIDGHWRREIVHGYSGEPIEAVIRAKSANSQVKSVYDEVPILISSLAYREEGIIGKILFPTEQQTVGGDSIQVTGTASSIPDNRLSLMLRYDDGLLDKQIIALDNPYQIDERVWSADLLTNGYLGEAFIDIAYTDPETDSEEVLDTISIIIGSVAG